MAVQGRMQRRMPPKSSTVKETFLSGPPLDIPIEPISLGQRYMQSLQDHKEKIHQVDASTGVTETKGALLNRSISVAVEMQARGIRSGDNVLFCSKCHADMTVALLATLLVGAVVVPMGVDLTIDEIQTRITTVRPKIAFCDIRTITQVDRSTKKLDDPLQCIFVLFGSEKKPDTVSFHSLISPKPIKNFVPFKVTDPKLKISFLFPTQGTTGKAKLCACSEYSVMVLSYLPINWAEQIIFTCATFEANIVRILAGAFNERSCCKLLHELKIDTLLLSTDYALQLIYHHSAAYDFNLSCFSKMLVGGLSLPPSKLKNLVRAFPNTAVYNTFGLTEAGCICYNNVTSPENKIGSVGKLMPGIRIYIEDCITHEHVGPNVVGELLIGGSQLLSRFYKDPHGTAAKLKRGYFRSGDLLYYDEDGYLFLKGIINDLIYVENETFFAMEMEDIIMKHRSVREAAVVGNGKEVAACIIKKQEHQITKDGLLDYLKDKVPDIQLPSRIKFYDTFPKSSIGKVKKYLLLEDIFDYVYDKSVTSLYNEP